MKGITHIWFRLIPWLIMNTFYKEGVKDLTFLPVLGNHDWYGGYENEILYSRYNKQWIFTTDYYLIKHPLKDGSKKYFVNLMINSCKFLWFDSGNRSWKVRWISSNYLFFILVQRSRSKRSNIMDWIPTQREFS